MKIDFDISTAEGFLKAAPHITALITIEGEESATAWASLEIGQPYRHEPADGIEKTAIEVGTPAHFNADGSPKTPELPSDPLGALAAASAGAGTTAITPGAQPGRPSSEPDADTTKAYDPLALLAAAESGSSGTATTTGASSDPLALLAAASSAPASPASATTQGGASPSDPLAALAAAASTQTPAAPTGSPAPASAEPVNPLAGLVAPPTVPEEFIVFGATGEKRAGYAHAADAVKVFVHDLNEVASTLDVVTLLWQHNQPLYDRQDRGGKMSMSRAYNKRKEEFAALMAAMVGSAPPEPETGEPGMTQDEFFAKFTAIASKTGPQAVVHVTKIFEGFGGTKFTDIPSEHWRKALEMIQQVVDNKGK